MVAMLGEWPISDWGGDVCGVLMGDTVWMPSEYEDSDELVVGRRPIGERVVPGARCFTGA